MVKSISNTETSIVVLIILNGNGEADELSLWCGGLGPNMFYFPDHGASVGGY